MLPSTMLHKSFEVVIEVSGVAACACSCLFKGYWTTIVSCFLRTKPVHPGSYTVCFEPVFSIRVFFILRKAIVNYCFVFLTNRASPQISDITPDMRQRALFVTSRAAWRWNKMPLARENVDSPLAAMMVATEHNALWASGCQPPSVDNGTSSRLNPVPAAWSMLAYHRWIVIFSLRLT